MAERDERRALVLGGGFAGLSAAIHLAVRGFAVTLLEQEASLGGKAGEWRQDGFRFDTGPHVLTLPQVFREVFEAAGEVCPLEFRPVSPLCRYRLPSGRFWDVYRDRDKTAAQLEPQEREVYLALLDEARRLYEGAADTFVYGSAPGWSDLLHYGLTNGRKAHPLKGLADLLESRGVRGDLLPFFLRFATYFGADPFRSPAVLHNIAWAELGLGVYYPDGGVAGLVQAMQGLAERLGVEVRCGLTVESIELADRRVRRVATTAGVFAADVVVSGLDIIRTHRLSGRASSLEKREPSLSGFVLLLGLEGETPQLRHHNILFPPDYRREFEDIRGGNLPEDPTLYVAVSSKTQAGDAPVGAENWFVMSNAPALPIGGANAPEQATRVHSEHLLGVLERRGFPVRSRIRVQRSLGPDHLARFAHRGAIYGHAPHSLTATLRPRQRLRGIDNLFLAGGTVYPGGGMPLAVLSGREAARLAATSLRS